MARIPEIIRRNPLSQVAPSAPSAGQAWSVLADVAGMAEDIARPAAQQAARIEGEKSTYRDPQTGELKVEERSLYGGELAEIHNNAAYAKYLAQKEIEIGQTMSELSLKHEFDPAGFNQATDAYLSILRADENVPEALKQSIVNSVEIESQRRFQGLRNAEVDRTYREADRDTKTARDLAVDDYVSLYVEGDFEAAEEKWKEIEEKSRFRADAPYISETPAEQEAYMKGARSSAKAARLIRDLGDLEGQSEISDEKRAEINAVLEDPDLSPQVRQRLYTATQSTLKAVDAASIVKGLTDDSYEAMVVKNESGGRNDARPIGEDGKELSSALGRHGFLEGTWLGLVETYKPEWAKGLNREQILEKRKDPQASSEMHAHFRRQNATQLAQAGLPVNPATEYMAHFFGAGGAVSVLSADPSKSISEIFPKDGSGSDGPGKGAPNGVPDIIDANPFLANMTAHDAKVWAARKMTMKASDIAAMTPQVYDIEDVEVRSLALKGLQDRMRQRQAIEAAEAAVFNERLTQGDPSLTEQEVLENHDLSTSDQARLVKGLSSARKEIEKLQTTVARVASGDTFNPLDASDRSDVDDVFKAQIGDADPISTPETVGAAAVLARETGIIPKTATDAIRGAIVSNDPASVAQGIETLSMLRDEAGGSLVGVTGAKTLENALVDYSFYGQFMDPEEAAQRLIENREKKPKNVTDEARVQADDLDISDIQNHFDNSWLSDPTIGDELAGEGSIELLPSMQQEEMMGEYRRLFQDEYKDTGDSDLAKARALDQMGRIYGVNTVSGAGRIMKFPPQKFYPPVSGSHDWMQEQLTQEINTALFEDEATPPGMGRTSLPVGQSIKWVNAKQIKVVSDGQTAAEAKTGKPPSYIVYANVDGRLEQLPARFYFDPKGYQEAAKEQFESDRANAIERDTDYYSNVERYGKEVADQMRRDQMGITAR